MIINRDYTLQFDEPAHRYLLNGVAVPSVTQVLAARRLYKGDEFWTDEARARGVAVHIATELWDQDDLDDSTLAPELSGYLEGWKAFRAQTGCQIELIEERFASTRWGCAGTIDRWVTQPDGKGQLIDLKTGQWQPAYALQIAAYRAMLAEHGVETSSAVCVTLCADGSFKTRYLDTLTLYRAEALFRAALELTKWHLAA